ncbi:hypothetical protein rosag_28730 [Roseisolibacter agri]|uniref:Flp family type IVb pilin n=2 Tax=Roseisolibacter agri TaxID=2014610 RepID=A0AA37Q4D5_9BACT|nr:hypothetical protein rosag_28730 [Roseisolibacter agri]
MFVISAPSPEAPPSAGTLVRPPMPAILRQQLRRFLQQDDGATLTEYALLVAMIAVAVVVGVNRLGGASSDKMNTAGSAMTASAGTADAGGSGGTGGSQTGGNPSGGNPSGGNPSGGNPGGGNPGGGNPGGGNPGGGNPGGGNPGGGNPNR